MLKNVRIFAIVSIVLILSACTLSNPGGSTPEINANPPAGAIGVMAANLLLTAKVVNAGDSFNAVGQIISYSYDLSNNSPSVAFAGPVVINSDKGAVMCPDLTTIGNADANLDPAEIVTCVGSYSITQVDLDAGVVSNHATASLNSGATTSNTVTLDTPLVTATTKVLTLTAAADSSTYSQVNQVITFTYVILNNGTTDIGPTQFTVNDSLISSVIGGPFNCGPANSTLPPNGLIDCTAPYNITQADLAVSSLTSSATATGGTITTDAVTTTLTNNSGGTQPPPSGLTPGSTIQHTVIRGEWLIQIARCYGADYKTVRNANLNIVYPALIWAGQVVTVPNIGSASTIYGPPCVVFHTAVAGDTWTSIAAKYNAREDVLREVNPGGLFTGAQIKVPINSAGGGASQLPSTVRINIPAGATSVTESGTVAANGKITYLAAASQGQTMTVTLTADAGQIAMGIYDPSGNTLLNPSNLALSWSGVLPANGDYRIELAGAAGATNKLYSIKVEITSP